MISSLDLDVVTNATIFSTTWAHNANGQIASAETTDDAGDFDYVYDYAGRLLSALNRSNLSFDRVMSYDSAGSIASKSDLGSYTYPAATANRPHAPTQAGSHSFSYDANGNMLAGLYGKTMSYDGENRPVSVSHQGDTTSYTYGPDGQRLKKTVTSSGTTLFAGAVEVRSYNAATSGSGTVAFFFCESIRVAGEGQFLYTTDFQLDGIFPLHIPTLADYMPHLSGRLHLCSRPDDSSETVGGFDPEVIIPA